MDDFKFKKSLGQNFLVDNNIKKKIIDAASVSEGSLIIEVGAGNGSLTNELVKLGVQVVSFEIDERLRNELEKINVSNLKIVFGDFLKVNLDSILSEYNYRRIHLIANLPYYITTPIINKVMRETNVDEMIVMVQKEVGDRFKAKPNSKDYNSLSVSLQYYFDIENITMVSSSCFVPRPKVDSIVIKFTRKKELIPVKDLDLFFRFVKDAFTQKRKNLRNNLKNYDLEKVEKALRDIGKDLTYRAEQISIEEFAYIVNYL